MATRTVAVKLVADVGAYQSSMVQAAATTRTVGDTATKTGSQARRGFETAGRGASLLAGVVGGALVVGLKSATDAAADAEQSLGAVDAVFKDYADGVKQSSREADIALGLSANSYRNLATIIGSQMKNAGVPLERLAAQTDDIIGIGADLAAQFGGSTQDAVEALSSAFRGELDPIERYGISLTAAAVGAKAVEMGLADSATSLDQNAKAMATLALITEQSGDAQGAFARETDTAAHRAQVAAAQWENLKVQLGDQLLPVWSSLVGVMSNDVIPALGGVLKAVGEVPGEFVLAGAAIGGYLLFGERLLAQLALMRVWMNASIVSPLIVGFANLATGAYSVAGAATAARTAVAGLLTTAAPLAVVAAIAYGVVELVKFANAGDDARDAIAKMNKTIDASDGNGARFSNVTGSLDEIRAKIDELSPFVESWSADNRSWFERAFVPVTGEVEDARQSLQVYQDALADIEAQQSRLDQNTQVLGRRYGMTKSEVEDFADAHGVDLSGSLQIVQGDFIRVAEAAGHTATGIGGVSGAAATGYENLVTYAAGLGLSDDATEELRKQTDELGSSLSKFADPLGAYTGLIEQKKEAEQQSAQATADATADQSDSWEDYVGDVTVSVAEYLAQLQAQVDAQTNWQTNMLTLASRVSQGTLDELARMGPEGAPLVAQLVTASDAELAQMEGLFASRSAAATSAWGLQLTQARPVLTQIASLAGQDVANSLAQQLAAGTTTVAAIAAQYGIVLADGINPVLASLGKSAIIPAAPRQIPGQRTPYATGGPVFGPGSGTSDSIPAMLSNGEFVIRASSVRKYGIGMLDNINEGRALFAKGGFVSSADVPRPSSTGSYGPPLSTGAQASMQAGYDAVTAFLTANAETAYSGAAGPAGGAAIGGGWQTIWNIVKAAIPAARINSTYRPGDPGYHGRGKAIDFGFGSGPGGAGSAGLASIARFLYNGYGSTLAELIYDGIGDDTPDVKNGRPHTYNAATRAQHANHVHAAVYDQGGLLPSGTAALNLSGSPELVLNPAQTAAAMRSREFSGGGAAGGFGAMPPLVIQARVWVGDREITEIARVEATAVVNGAMSDMSDRAVYKRVT